MAGYVDLMRKDVEMRHAIAPSGWGNEDTEPSISESDDTARGNGESTILVANEPRSYREAIATVLRELCTVHEVLVAEPEALDLEVARAAPGMVVCSRATSLVEKRAVVWVELYPNHGRLTVISIGGRRSTLREIQLKDLISIVDQGMSRVRAQ